MRRLSATTFDGAAGAHAWSPMEVTPPGAAINQASPQREAYRKAYLEGFEAGFADGDTDARRILQEAQEAARAQELAARAEQERWRGALATLAEQFASVQNEHQAQMEALAATIGFACVSRVVGRMHAESALIAALCREALESMHIEPTQVRVSPADRASLDRDGSALPIVADPTLQPGDCIIETPLGGIDTGIEVRLRSVLQALLETLGRKAQT